MGISIIGKEFSEATAKSYAKNPALRAPQRDSGASIQERNRLFKIADAKRRGTSFGNDFSPAPEPTDTAPEWRTMYMMAYPGYEHVFAVAPGSFTVEGFGAELSEIPRPYNVPIVDIKAGKSRRVSFEFLLVKRAVALDLTNPLIPKQTFYINNFYANIEEEIKQLQLIADMGMPVGFDNVNAIMRENYWYIDNLTFTYTRDNRTGETVSAQCNISLIEYKPLRQKFILLPKFRYGKFSITKKPAITTGNTKGVNDPLYWQKVAGLAKLISQTQGLGSIVGIGGL